MLNRKQVNDTSQIWRRCTITTKCVDQMPSGITANQQRRRMLWAAHNWHATNHESRNVNDI